MQPRTRSVTSLTVPAGRRWRDWDRGETRPVQRPHDQPIELSYVGLNPCRRQAAGRSRAPLAEAVTTREDVTVRTRTVDNQERLAKRSQLSCEPTNRGGSGRPEMCLL